MLLWLCYNPAPSQLCHKPRAATRGAPPCADARRTAGSFLKEAAAVRRIRAAPSPCSLPHSAVGARAGWAARAARTLSMVWPRSCSVCSDVSADHCAGMLSMPTPHALGVSSPEIESSSSCARTTLARDPFRAIGLAGLLAASRSIQRLTRRTPHTAVHIGECTPTPGPRSSGGRAARHPPRRLRRRVAAAPRGGAHPAQLRQLGKRVAVGAAVQALHAQHAQARQAGDRGQRAAADREEVVAVLHLQLHQAVPQHAQHHAQVRHAEVVLRLEADEVAIVCARARRIGASRPSR